MNPEELVKQETYKSLRGDGKLRYTYRYKTINGFCFQTEQGKIVLPDNQVKKFITK